MRGNASPASDAMKVSHDDMLGFYSGQISMVLELISLSLNQALLGFIGSFDLIATQFIHYNGLVLAKNGLYYPSSTTSHNENILFLF